MSFILRLILFVVIPGVLISVLLINRFSESAPDPYANNNYSSPRLEKPSEELSVEPSLDSKKLDEALNAIVSGNPELGLSISVHNFKTAGSYGYGDKDAYFAASVTKLVTAAAYLKQTELGNFSLSQNIGGDTAHNQLKKMVYISDNGAWNAMRTELGHQNITNFARGEGLSSFDSQENLISSADMNLFLTKLKTNQILSPDNSFYLLELMKKGDQNYPIELSLGNNAVTYHKYGWLPDRLTTALIVEQDGKAIAITVFSKSEGAYDFAHGKNIFGEIVRATLDSFS